MERIDDHIDLLIPHIERMYTADNVWNDFVQPKSEEDLQTMTSNCLKVANQTKALIIRGSGMLEKKKFPLA